jgi:putative flippase GtrA
LKRELTPWLSGMAHKLHPKLGELYDWAPSYWNYAIVGGLGILLNWALFILLRGFLGDIAWWIGIITAWHSNFLLSKVWVFKHETKVKEGKK